MLSVRIKVLLSTCILSATPLSITAKQTTQDLLCTLESQTPTMVDRPVGSIRTGYLRIYGEGKYSTYVINLDGFIINTDSGKWVDTGDVIKIKNSFSAAIYSRSSGKLRMHYKYDDMNYDSEWSCTEM